MLDYINGNKFLDIADFAIDFDHDNLSMDVFKKDAIIFCKTDFILQLFNHLRFSSRKYILITHMSDYPINQERFNSRPPCITKWYAQNAIYDHPDLISIPLGVENHAGGSKGPFTDHKWLNENEEILKNNPKEPVLYCHWNTANNPARGEINNILKQKNNVVVQETRLSYEGYIEGMSRHKFIVCPVGNGVDTHRLWEAMYIGCTPISLRHRIYRDYNLPIIQVDNWSDITSELLSQPITESVEQIYMRYWRKRIKDEFNKL